MELVIIINKLLFMDLLSEDELVWSTVVANSTMNRERQSSGINSYEKEFKFKPENFLKQHIEKYGKVSWLDLCCGQGKALIQSASFLFNNGLQSYANLKGIDLIDGFGKIPMDITCLGFEVKSVADLSHAENYDLITCVHGLHYVGNKLKVLETIFASLNTDGLFLANFNIESIFIDDKNTNNYLKKIFIENGIKYNHKAKIIECIGKKELKFNFKYLGANDKAGANYTGQEAVDSYYSTKFYKE